MSKKVYSLIACLMPFSFAFAQNSRFSLDLNGGIPVPFTSIKPDISTFGGIGLRYNLTAAVSVEGMLNIGTFSGSQNVDIRSVEGTDNNSVTKFTNNFFQYSVKGMINLDRVFRLRRAFHRLNPYLTGGAGYTYSNIDTKYLQAADYKVGVNIYTAYAGILIKYYINPALDFNIGSEFNATQSYYLDGAPTDNKYDHYLLNYVGIAYKFGARKDRQHIEWNNVILRDRIYIPDIEKRQGQPLDAAGNYFVFHKDSITKLQAQNIELKQKTAELEEKSVSQQKQIDSMQSQVKDMKSTIDTIQNKVNQMKDQMDKQPNVVYVPTPVKPDNTTTAAPVKTEPVKPAVKNSKPKPAESVKEPKPVTRVEEPAKTTLPENKEVKEQPAIPTNTLTEGLNQIDGVVTPIAKYNVVAGAYAGTKYAYIFRDKMRAKGYEAAVFRSDVNSHILRVCVFTSEDKNEALKVMRKIREEVDPKAWIHVYYQK